MNTLQHNATIYNTLEYKALVFASTQTRKPQGRSLHGAIFHRLAQIAQGKAGVIYINTYVNTYVYIYLRLHKRKQV